MGDLERLQDAAAHQFGWPQLRPAQAEEMASANFATLFAFSSTLLTALSAFVD